MCIGGEDFVPVILNVTFEAGETLRNVNVTIIPDEIVEEDEMFYVQLEGFEDQPNTISEPDGAWVTIFDDDSKLVFMYLRIYVTISIEMIQNSFYEYFFLQVFLRIFLSTYSDSSV